MHLFSLLGRIIVELEKQAKQYVPCFDVYVVNLIQCTHSPAINLYTSRLERTALELCTLPSTWSADLDRD